MNPIDFKTVMPGTKAYEPPVEKLANSKALTEDQKLAQLSKSFEAMLLRQILEEAQKPVFRSKFVSDSATSSIYRDMVTTQMAESIAQSGTLGLSSILTKQMRRPPAESQDQPPSSATKRVKPAKLFSPKTA